MTTALPIKGICRKHYQIPVQFLRFKDKFAGIGIGHTYWRGQVTSTSEGRLWYQTCLGPRPGCHLLSIALLWNGADSLRKSKWDVYIGVGASQVVLVVKNPTVSAGDVRDMGLIPGSGRSPGGGHGNPLQYSCLGNSLGQRSLVGYSP